MEEVEKKSTNKLKSTQSIKFKIPNNQNISAKEEEYINLNMFDFNILSKIFTFLTIPYGITDHSIFIKNFTYCNDFGLVSKLFNEISNQTKFKYNLFQNTIYTKYKIYLNISYAKENLNELLVNEKNLDRWLKYCSQLGFYDLIDFLLSNAKNVDQKTLDVSLLLSCRYGLLKTSKILLYYGPNVNDSVLGVLLMFAVESRNIKLVKHLVKNNADVEYQDHRSHTAIFLAIGYKNLDIVKLLISKNCNLNHKNYVGNTPLFHAIALSTFEIIEFLISQTNLDLNLKNNLNKTALDLAIEREDENIIDLIKKYLEK